MGHDIGPFSTATAMLAALDAKEVSAAELTELHLGRIAEHDGALNAVPVRTPERARAAAAAADTARARGERGPLLGLPMTLKESTLTAGLPQSAGIPAFKDHVGPVDGPIARRVFAAGAALLGKTNIPVALGDWQADSPVYGRAVNPWDHARTPGGSTGGGGAALAAGLTPLEIGSDIGGSIRVPAAYCGVYGHRPSETAIPKTGAFPMGDLPNAGTIMGVQGPLARSAVDLELLFDVVAGPEEGEDAGWRLALPAARHDRLAEFRVAVMPALPWVAPSAAMAGRVDELAAFLSAAGARVGTALPDVDLDAYFRDYLVLLMMMMSIGQPRAQREAQAEAMARSGGPFSGGAAGLVIDASDLQMVLARRAAAQQAWRAFFRDWDVLVCPTALDAAFGHATGEQDDRTLTIDDRTVPYQLNIVYPMWAIFTGQPATAFPAGLDPRGLPLGLQAIGPYLEDRTTLRFAQLLEREWHAFVPPPGY
jgi:amidase